ncbi:hypothetical protein PO909_014638 [Leuciscus waleckii]
MNSRAVVFPGPAAMNRSRSEEHPGFLHSQIAPHAPLLRSFVRKDSEGLAVLEEQVQSVSVFLDEVIPRLHLRPGSLSRMCGTPQS